MRKQFQRIICIAVIALTLSGCQQAPEKDVIVSKNDGTFDATKANSAVETHAPDEVQIVAVDDVFFSTDGSVEFQMKFEETVSMVDMPIVRVEPHPLTVQNAKNVAYALFGDNTFYEVEPSDAPVYSKDEIQKKLLRWAPFGGSDGIAGEFIADVVDKFIIEYTLLLETAPIENPHKPCEWAYKSETYYYYSEAVASTMNTDDDNDQIRAKTTEGDIPYLYTVSTRNKSDFKLNNIYARPYDGSSPATIDYSIFRSELCRTNKPNEETLTELKEKAALLLEQMNLGDWQIDECYVEEVYNNDIAEYIVHINAVPVFRGVAALRRPQLNNLTSNEAYASNYYLTNATFQFSANGDLVYFELYSPVDVKDVVNPNVSMLSMDELIARAEEYFAHSDYYEYGFGNAIDIVDEDLCCTVNVDSVKYGLTRVKVANATDNFYYLPAVSFEGNAVYYGVDSGNTYYSGDESSTLLILNAIDGSVINVTNE